MQHFSTRVGIFITTVSLACLSFLPYVSQAVAAENPFNPHACDDTVQLAPIISTSTGAKRQAAEPDIHPQDTPVIFIHGWISRSTHTPERTGTFSQLIDRQANEHAGIMLAASSIHDSMIDRAQKVNKTAVYTFDYSHVHSRWVTHKEIGPKLARGIECLARQYNKPVTVVGHSMGGLAVREAATHLDSSRPVEKWMSNVVMIGTPNTGSDLAQSINRFFDSAPLRSPLALPIRLWWDHLKKCAERKDQTNEGCYGIDALDAFRGEAGQALRTHSKALDTLPMLPQAVHVHAMVGNIEFGGFSLFGRTSKPLISAGDVIVSTKSASAGADTVNMQTCRYGFIAGWAVKESWNRLRLLTKGKSVDRPATMFSSPCFHSYLLKEKNINDDLTNILTRITTQGNK
ncbi:MULTISPECIES: esterase/lipase family protein [unclassified Schaalia]|uniref:esterase/lipase family protein n=1 Tax=unclassified Schaalia TaxID=2691889 RepID=UPI001E5B67C3|nr:MULTISPECIES: alpha/beta fold hydrolase [unclassified Schaalia]MCD4549287.1 alpha/beta fold hydrolase [Schaalia sp. lx-260]MCD4557096.1 alpha/beta fold hydrolase [Schaalia sp. lx-100]